MNPEQKPKVSWADLDDDAPIDPKDFPSVIDPSDIKTSYVPPHLRRPKPVDKK